MAIRRTLLKYEIAFFVVLSLGALISFQHAHAASVYVPNVTALYHFDNDVTDSSGNGYDFAATGGQFGSAKFGSASWDSINTDDTTNYLLASSSVISSWNDFSVGFWIKPEAAFGLGYVLTTDIGTTNSVNFGHNRLCLDSFEYKLITTCQSVGGIELSTSTWHWVLLTRTAGLVDFYVDNYLEEERSIAGTFSSNSAIRVNGQYSDHGHGLPFLIDELFFASSSISSSTRDFLYSSGNGENVCTTPGCGTAPTVVVATGTLAQYKADGTTAIGSGASTAEDTVKLSAELDASGVNTSTLKLQIEVEPSSTAFTGTPTASGGSFVTSGATSTIAVGGLANGAYHWQARAIDLNNNTSSWQRFGANATGTDFVVSIPAGTSTVVYVPNITALYHFDDTVADSSGNGHDFTATGGQFGSAKFGGASWDSIDTDDTTNYLLASSSVISSWDDFSVGFWLKPEATFGLGYVLTTDIGTSNSVNFGHNRLCLDSFEYKLITTCQAVGGIELSTSTWHWVLLTRKDNLVNFYVDDPDVPKETRTISGTFSSNSDIRVNGQYSDHYHGLPFLIDELFFSSSSVSTSTRDTLWDGGAGKPICATVGCESETVLSIVSSSLGQYMSDATSTIGEGSTTPESTVVFRAKLGSTGTSTEQLQVEVKPASFSFSNVANVTSSFLSPDSNATATIIGLANASYHWQARVIDENGHSTTWQTFGPSIYSTDLTVAVPMSAHFDGSSALAYPASNVAFTAADPFTIEFWYRTPTSTITSIESFIDTRNTSTHEGFLVNRDMGYGVHFRLECDSGLIDFYAASSSANSNGSGETRSVWHQVTITKDATSTLSAFNLYFDGVPRSLELYPAGSEGPVSGNCFSSSSSIWLGKDSLSTSTPSYLTGDMDELRISDTRKSESDVSSTWNKEATSISGLRGLWQFNGTSTDLVTSNSTSGAYGGVTFATSSPFGHFLRPWTSVNATASQLLWHYAAETYLSSVAAASDAWNALGSVTLASTTATSSIKGLVDLQVFDVNHSTGTWVGVVALSTAYATSSDELDFNSYYIDGDNCFPLNFLCEYGSDRKQNMVMHELGHSLGLDHSYLGNVMNYYITSQTILGEQDVGDYRFLWGGN